MANQKYNKEKVLEIIANFFHQDTVEEYLPLPFEKVYSEIVKFAAKKHRRVQMPKFTQARKLIISENLSSQAKTAVK